MLEINPEIAAKKPQTYYMTGTSGMLFRTFDSKLMMSIHSHNDVNGRHVCVPHFFEVDDSGDKLKIKN
jgi:hypothetical protein